MSNIVHHEVHIDVVFISRHFGALAMDFVMVSNARYGSLRVSAVLPIRELFLKIVHSSIKVLALALGVMGACCHHRVATVSRLTQDLASR